MQSIVTDEQRGIAAKAARRCAVARESPLAASQRSSGATSPAFALLLSSELSRAILAYGI